MWLLASDELRVLFAVHIMSHDVILHHHLVNMAMQQLPSDELDVFFAVQQRQ